MIKFDKLIPVSEVESLRINAELGTLSYAELIEALIKLGIKEDNVHDLIKAWDLSHYYDPVFLNWVDKDIKIH